MVFSKQPAHWPVSVSLISGFSCSSSQGSKQEKRLFACFCSKFNFPQERSLGKKTTEITTYMMTALNGNRSV
ncbi:unnamed protein product [Pseudo-nitzschia multistriata]|uniref:Uncharacterized protein n=1 Tax=Pseudo-nitzschia multistriata TaxID=183589 RepID=A0A448Z0B7_9STRA|nr:unnamed protein product [Pseudo-nitzschia multistriata]